jgi:hypothetical protein
MTRRRPGSKRSRSTATASLRSPRQSAGDPGSASAPAPDPAPARDKAGAQPQGPQGQAARKSRLRRAGKAGAAWTGGIVAAALATLLTGVLTGVPRWVHATVSGAGTAGGKAGTASGRVPAAPPLAYVAMTSPVPCRPGSGWVVPDRGQRVIQFVQGGSPAGAVLSSGGNVIITVQGTAGRTVVLQSMTVAVVRRAAPMKGIYLPAGCQGGLAPRHYALSLDSPAPRPVPQPGDITFPYTVSNDDPEQFIITPEVTAHEVQWRLYLTWTSGASHGRLVLDDSGRPFITTPAAGARQFCNTLSDWEATC